jgi:hypothetical protein
MKMLLEVPENKAGFLLELLKNLPFIKVKTLSDTKAKVLEDVKEAVEEMKLIKAGKMNARNAEDLINEL